MRYYYFNPVNKKCYFPTGFQKYPLFTTFYQPYKLSAVILWKIWRTSSLFRNMFSTHKPEKVLPINNIQKYVSSSSIFAFSLGTKGIEQKITVLGIDTVTKETFFIKYATSEIARNNVSNEGLVLQQISHLSFVPKLKLYVKEDNKFTLIKTSVLNGEKIKRQPLNAQLLKILCDLTDERVQSNKKCNSILRSCFAHGDFCPWNMLNNNGVIELYDWELAGQYPLGYDLFTYIFQYEFLVKEVIEFEKIINSNINAIQQYFSYIKVKDWRPYLLEFSKLKHIIELEKENKDLIKPYLYLKKYSATL